LAPAGVPLAYTIVVIDSQVVLAAALALGVLATALCIGALRTRRARRRIRAASPAPQAAVPPYPALGGAR